MNVYYSGQHHLRVLSNNRQRQSRTRLLIATLQRNDSDTVIILNVITCHNAS